MDKFGSVNYSSLWSYFIDHRNHSRARDRVAKSILTMNWLWSNGASYSQPTHKSVVLRFLLLNNPSTIDIDLGYHPTLKHDESIVKLHHEESALRLSFTCWSYIMINFDQFIIMNPGYWCPMMFHDDYIILNDPSNPIWINNHCVTSDHCSQSMRLAETGPAPVNLGCFPWFRTMSKHDQSQKNIVQHYWL